MTETFTDKRVPSNIVLVGMPGAGKSTVGVVLAKAVSKDFIDTDLLIQTNQRKSLQQILDESGYLALRRVEKTILLRLDCRNTVIATGGSAVYSPKAMNHLKLNGLIVFLQVGLACLRHRLQDFNTRGIACRPDQSFSDLFRKRGRLYEKVADLIIDCGDMDHEQISGRICQELNLL
jgi:shikimate kinase